MTTHTEQQLCTSCGALWVEPRYEYVAREGSTLITVSAHCLPAYAYRCDPCNRYATTSAVRHIEHGAIRCLNCVSEARTDSGLVRYRDCIDCDVTYDINVGHECYSEDDSDDQDWATENGVHAWNYRPTPNFHGHSPLQFGIELEMDLGSERGYRDNLAAMRNEDLWEENFYFKQDGSLNSYGVELVTHPRDLDSWRHYADRFGAMLQSTSADGGRAWTRDECGLHIHLSRAGFDSTAHIARFALFFARNRDPWTTLANRRSSYATWSGLQRNDVMPKVKDPDYAGHYDAVSLAPRRTIEVRIFRPSLAIGRIIGSIELVAAAVEYTRLRTSTLDDFFTWGNFRDYVTDDNYPYAAHIMRGGKFDPARKLHWSIKKGN